MTVGDIPDVVDLLYQMYQESPTYKALAFDIGRIEEMAGLVMEGGFAVVYEASAAVADGNSSAEPQKGEIVGVMAGATYKPAFSRDLMACDYVLYVRPDFRGFVAVRLVAAFIAWAKSKGVKLITAGVTAGIDNDKAIQLYEIMGFKKSGVSLMMEV
jgi:GNAT superfamily N-acetyltransferase